MKTQISVFPWANIGQNDHSNPYIESTTVLSDIVYTFYFLVHKLEHHCILIIVVVVYIFCLHFFVYTLLQCQSSPSLSPAPVDYDEVDTPDIIYGSGQTEKETSIIINADRGDSAKVFYLNVIPVRTAIVLTPRIEVEICGTDGKRFSFANVNYMSLTVDLRMRAE